MQNALSWPHGFKRSADLSIFWALALLYIAEHMATDFAHLDFLRAFGDAVPSMVAIDVLKGLVARVTNAAVCLHGLIGGVANQAVGPVVTH